MTSLGDWETVVLWSKWNFTASSLTNGVIHCQSIKTGNEKILTLFDRLNHPTPVHRVRMSQAMWQTRMEHGRLQLANQFARWQMPSLYLRAFCCNLERGNWPSMSICAPGREEDAPTVSERLGLQETLCILWKQGKILVWRQFKSKQVKRIQKKRTIKKTKTKTKTK